MTGRVMNVHRAWGLSTFFRSGRWSAGMLIVLMLVIATMRTRMLGPNELSWDVFGYYLYLPALFIHHDPMLHDISWIHEAVKQPGVSGTLYQLTWLPDGRPIYFFLMGAALLYLPFFLLGHAIAWITGAPMDGFSLPYQYAIALGCMTYTLIGLVHARRILRHFFSDGLTAAVLAIVVLGTNYLHFVTLKNLETANFLFFGISVLVWNTIQWHLHQRRSNLLWIAFIIAVIALVKPSEVICGLIPVLWGVHDKASLRAKWALIVAHWRDFALAVGVAACVGLPQVTYWMLATGRPLYDSYYNPGVGLDFFHPHVVDVLFSFRKGWLIYTPVMGLALIGFYFLWKQYRNIFFGVTVYFLCAFWIISSWSEWWYGASYSIRPMITSYPLLAITLGLTLQRASISPFWRWCISGACVFFICFNLFQLWQFYHYILEPYRTTRAYWFAILGKTSVGPEERALLMVERSFDADQPLPDLSRYQERNLGHYDFDHPMVGFSSNTVVDTASGTRAYCLDGDAPFAPSIETTFESITPFDHAVVKAQVDVFIPEDHQGGTPSLVISMSRKDGEYGYHSIPTDTLPRGKWCTVKTTYLTPSIRNVRDRLKVYVWQGGTDPVLIDNFDVTVFAPKW
jgi:hypothetical protein